MSEYKFTPGPWAAYGFIEGTGAIGVCAGRIGIADVHNAPSAGELIMGNAPLTQQANAKLIAAAPCLLSALKDLLLAYEDPGNTGSTHDEKVLAARAAINKATA